MSEMVIVYGQPDCPPCEWVKAFLDREGVAYEVRDVVADPAALAELRAHGSQSTPTVVIGDEVLIGFEEAKLRAALE